MRTHPTLLLSRILRAGSRLPPTMRYRVVAVGLSRHGDIIGLATNAPRFARRGGGLHAEHALISRSPRSLRTILLARVGRLNQLLPIEPCARCARLAAKRGVEIRQYER